MTIRESSTLEVISASFLTRRRITRDFRATLLMLFFLSVILARVTEPGKLLLLLAAFALTSALVRPAVRRFIDTCVPEHVRSRLPYGPLDVAETPGAPHTYLDLCRIWRSPSFQCSHNPDLRVPIQARSRLVIVPATLLFGIAATAIAAEIGVLAFDVRHPNAIAAVAALVGLLAEGVVAVLWNRALRSDHADVPTNADVWITFSLAAMAVLAGLAIAFARSSA